MPIRILVADDYADWRVLIRSVVQQRSDIQVIREVGDGVEALAKTEELKPDLVLLDIGLPGLNGIEVARYFRMARHPLAVVGFLPRCPVPRSNRRAPTSTS